MQQVSSTAIATVSAVVAVGSLFVSAYLAWVTKIGPPRLLGMASCLALYTFTDERQGTKSRFLAPAVWLTNVGARSMLVQGMRLTIQFDEGPAIELAPTHSVPSEAIEQLNTFSEYDQVRLGLSPFGGFAVLPGERWVNNYVFELSAEEFARFRGDGLLSLTVQKIGTRIFKVAISQKFSFEPHPYSWLRWAEVGPSVDYFYPVEFRYV